MSVRLRYSDTRYSATFLIASTRLSDILAPSTSTSGSVIIEQIFGVPGLGRYFVQGALNRDYTLVMGVVIFYGVLIIALNFIVDVVYSWLDPRLKI